MLPDNPRIVATVVMQLALMTVAEGAMVTDATALWTSVPYPGPGPYDTANDQKSGGSPQTDIVGNTTNSALYLQFDNGGTVGDHTDGTILFRARLGTPGTGNVYDENLFIGIDADGNGDIDIYLGVHNHDTPDELAIYQPGAGANNTFNTTVIGTADQTYSETSGTNYLYTTVDTTSTDLDADGNTDYFLSFSFPFNALVSLLATAPYGNITIDDTSPLRYLLGTSTNQTALDQDINGVPNSFNKDATWLSLGTLSSSFSPISTIPEPSSSLLVGLGALLVTGLSRRRKRAAASGPDSACSA